MLFKGVQRRSSRWRNVRPAGRLEAVIAQETLAPRPQPCRLFTVHGVVANTKPGGSTFDDLGDTAVLAIAPPGDGGRCDDAAPHRRGGRPPNRTRRGRRQARRGERPRVHGHGSEALILVSAVELQREEHVGGF